MKRHAALILSMLCLLILAADAPPLSPIRRDATFWDMLTPAGRQVLSGVSFYLRERCQGATGRPFVGARYNAPTHDIEMCGEGPTDVPERIRHEALHALDWVNGASGEEITPKMIPGDLYARAEQLYLSEAPHGWFRAADVFAMLPIVVGWDFDQLPQDTIAAYAPWFQRAQGPLRQEDGMDLEIAVAVAILIAALVVAWAYGRVPQNPDHFGPPI